MKRNLSRRVRKPMIIGVSLSKTSLPSFRGKSLYLTVNSFKLWKVWQLPFLPQADHIRVKLSVNSGTRRESQQHMTLFGCKVIG